jgi:16S rRNA (guanine527-N7)-methyltransferase
VRGARRAFARDVVPVDSLHGRASNRASRQGSGFEAARRALGSYRHRVTNAAAFKAMAAAIDCELSLEAAEQLLAYLDAMLDENQRINLTAVREREAAVMFHALDSVAMGSAAFGLEVTACLDLGTGNGFPGVAALCLYPEAEVVLMDRTLKKLKAIERALDVAGLTSERVRTVQMNAIEAPKHGHKRKYDLVAARAVGDAFEVGLLARPLLTQAGSFLCWMSPEQRAKSKKPEAYREPEFIEYTLPEPAARERVLAHYRRP